MKRWLAVLSLAVLGCGSAPPRVGGRTPMLSLEHRSSMGESFQLVGLRAELDGLPLVSLGDPDATLEAPAVLATPICVLATRVAPGSHSLRIDEGGGVATPIEERPAIAWHVDVVRDGSVAGCTVSAALGT